VDSPLHYKILRVGLAAGQTSAYAGPASMLYALSGSADVVVEGDRRNLREGGASFVPAGRPAALAAAGSAAVLLQFVLAAPAEREQAAPAAPASVAEIYRTPKPIPALKPGPHEFTLTRVSVERGSPRPPMHYRTGAAVYWVLSGAWSLHQDGARIEARTRGAVQFEPSDFVHSWQNVGDTTATLLQANISPEGSPEIIFMPPR
jgi:quercetin dioxygenase-like cupin family protein